MKQYSTRICKECGQEFVPTNPSQVYCKRPHYRKCPICGKEYLVKRTNLGDPPRACLGECSKELRRRTNLKRYGVEDSGNMKSSIEKRRRTCLERYGVDNPAKCSDFVEKSKASNFKKYGVEWSAQSEEVKKKIQDTWNHKSDEELNDILEKRKSTNLEKFGYEWPQQNSEVIQRTKRTNVKKYGVECSLHCEESKRKTQKTLFERYGEHPFSSEEIQKRRQSGSMRKYGVSHPNKSDVVKQHHRETLQAKYGESVTNIRHIPGVEEKIQKTNQLKYGSKTYLTSENLQKVMMRDGSKYDEYMKFKDDPKSYIESNFSNVPNVYEVAEHLGVTDTSVYTWLDKFNCRDSVSFTGSVIEREIIGFLKESVPRIIIKHNDKTIISPQELDIYLPEYQVAIECNPTCTHNSTFVDPWGGDPKSYKYHQEKSIRCRNSGVFLFHIFGYEWSTKKHIINSMLLNILGKTPNKIYARCTEVREIDTNTAIEFLNSNHRQGYSIASIRLGLYYQDELVSVMLFNKVRGTLGYKKNHEIEYELSRFCSKLDTAVVGGASKLFSYFLKTYEPKSVVSFSDIAHTQGKLYKILGFSKISESDPSYVWVNTLNDSYLSRVRCQKSKLSSIFKLEQLDLTKTEKEIMSEHGYAQVFDSGVVRWEWYAH